jgi:hypothetical protein
MKNRRSKARELTRHAADSAQRASKKEAAAESTRAQRDRSSMPDHLERRDSGRLRPDSSRK